MRGPLTAHPDRGHRQVGGLVLLLMWAAAGAALIGGTDWPVKTYPLAASQIGHWRGCAYVVRIPQRPLGWPLVRFAGDSLESPASRLVLSEDGRPLLNPHAAEADMDTPGAEGYLHWGAKLFFFLPDCSDPRTNGRRYDIAVPWSPSWLSYGLLSAGWLYLGFVLTKGWSGDASDTAVRRVYRAAGEWLVAPADLLRRPRLAAAAAVALTLWCLGALTWQWSLGLSQSFSLGGLFPVSDAAGYWNCANSLLDNRDSAHPMGVGDWCDHRAIYPNFLAGLTLIGARHLLWTLALQAALTAAAVFVLIRRLSPRLPSVATLACAWLLVGYAAYYALAMTTTENAGLIFGCLALALLLRAVDERSLLWLMAGSAMLSIALNSRAGAFFVLPALVLWAGLVARFQRRRVWPWVLGTAIAVLAGFAVQTLLVLATGGDPAATHGNFSYTLYGLSVGGKGWSQVTLDHPELFGGDGSDASRSSAIYALAWQNLTGRPGTLLDGLSASLSLYLERGSYGYQSLGLAAPLVQAFWWLAWLPMIRGYRDPHCLLIALLSLGIAAAAPLLMGDGGPRIFAATVAVDATQIAIGIALAVAAAARLCGIVPTVSTSEPEPKSSRPGAEGTVALLALAILLVPHTPLVRLGAQRPVSFNACAAGEEAVATRINRGGTIAVSIVADGQTADFARGEVARDALARGIPPACWWRPGVMSLTGGSLLRAVQLRPDDPARPWTYYAYGDESLSRYDGKLVGLCLDRGDSKLVFGDQYRKLRSVVLLE